MKLPILNKHQSFVCCCVLILVAISTVFIAPNNSRADDWGHWRGPNWNDQSSETGLLQEWPEGGPKQIWLNQTAGLGYAGIAVVGDRLYTLGLEDNSEFALCISAETGTEIWRTPVGERFKNGWGDGPRSTPFVDDDRVYVMTADGTLACLQSTEGNEIWSVKMQDFGGTIPSWGFAESPLVSGDHVVCTPGGEQTLMIALNKMTGEKVWLTEPLKRKLDSGDTTTAFAHYSSIVPIEFNMQKQYVQLTPMAVVGVAADDGEILWQSAWPGRVAVIPSPIVEDGKVYITSGYSVGSKMIELSPGEDGGTKASELWFNKVMQNHHGGVIKVGDYIYGSNADIAFVCQDWKTGERMWAQRVITKGTLTYADSRFYHVQENDGKVLLFAADEKQPSLKGHFTMSPQTKRRARDGRIWVHPVIANGKLFLRDQEIIYCYDIKQPESEQP